MRTMSTMPHPVQTRFTTTAPGAKGAELQRAAMQKTGGLRPAHQYVPWVVVNGIPLMDAYQDLGTIICAAYQGPK
jgi:interferon gamma-inducible protein 30